MTWFQTALQRLREGNRFEALRFLTYALGYGAPEERRAAERILNDEYSVSEFLNYQEERRRAEERRRQAELERQRRKRSRANYSGFASTRMRRALSDEEIRRAAPAVFAESQWSELSGSYRFFRTDTLVREMRGSGFEVVEVQQGNSIDPERARLTKHLLRFVQRERLNSRGYAEGEEVPEIILVNSHDGRSSWQLRGGIFRCVCSNGLVVASEEFGMINIRHVGHDYADVISASLKLTERVPAIQDKIARMKSISLSSELRREMASASAKFLGEKTELRNPQDLLEPRRRSDGGNSLWTTFNVIQENLIRGGLDLAGETRSRDGFGRPRPARSRQISSIDRGISVNSRLWALAESYLPENSGNFSLQLEGLN